ncbi:unnamed protein product [Caenorhabditis nigoni]
MTKKQKKKDKKAAATAAGAVSKDDAQNKKENDLDLLEDIKRDEDLYISESDVTNISNFIRTTNKSFNSLGNSVLAFFDNRCSLAILHALIALFDVDGEDQEDVVRRLNIIYIVWRLPDMEQYMRLKPAKTIADVHAHPFATFLFWAEQLEQHEAEATLARIIVTCNVGVVEKLTALEFQKKAKSLDLHKVERDAFEKWAELNMDHWPEITEEMVPLVKAMRELGMERKDYEAGMAEAFYPLVHNAPTLLPPRMHPDDLEDPSVANFRRMIDPKHEEAEQVVYSKSAGPDMQKELLKAFEDLETTVVEYQSEIFSGMTQPELDEAQRQIEFTGRMVESSASSECPTEIDSEDSEIEAESEFKAMTQMTYADDDKIIEGCVDRVVEGIGLTTSKSDRLIQFVKYGPQSHPQFKRLLAASEDDEFVQKFCRNNNRICASFLVRTALNDKATDPEQCLFGSLIILPRGPFISRPSPDEQSPPTNRPNFHRPIEIRSKRNPLILEENEQDQRKGRAENTRPSFARDLFGELSVQFRRPRELSESDSEDVKNSGDSDEEDKENDRNSMIPMEIGEENGLRASNGLNIPIEIRSKRNPLILEENEQDKRKRRAEKTFLNSFLCEKQLANSIKTQKYPLKSFQSFPLSDTSMSSEDKEQNNLFIETQVDVPLLSAPTKITPPSGHPETECPTVINSKDSEIEAESEFNAMPQMTFADDDPIIKRCVDCVVEGIGLTTSKSDRLIQFVKYGPQSHPQFKRLFTASEDDEFIQKFCRNNNRICASFLVRTALNDKATDPEQCLFGRYMRILQSIGSIVQAFETVVKLGKEFKELNRLQASHRSIVMDYIRHVISVVETAENATDRAIRLVAVLIRKLITEKVVILEELDTAVKPFCLKHNTNRYCQALYQIVFDVQRGVAPHPDAVAVLADDDDDADLIVTTPAKLLTSSRTTTTMSSDADSQTTVTTETKSVENAQQKMTMTTVVERSGDQNMQTSEKQGERKNEGLDVWLQEPTGSSTTSETPPPEKKKKL